MKKLLSIFVIAFLLNLLWENAQAPLYQSYVSFWQHFWICLPASFWDAGYITLLYLFITLIKKNWFWGQKRNSGKVHDREKTRHALTMISIVTIGLATATFIELRALAQERWDYTDAMPLVPIIHIGLTPFLQLAILSIVTYTVVDREIAAPQRGSQ